MLILRRLLYAVAVIVLSGLAGWVAGGMVTIIMQERQEPCHWVEGRGGDFGRSWQSEGCAPGQEPPTKPGDMRWYNDEPSRPTRYRIHA